MDDTLPVDANNRVLLPSANTLPPVVDLQQSQNDVSTSQIMKLMGSNTTQSIKMKKDEEKKSQSSLRLKNMKISVWPFILSKALLKLAALTWTRDKEIWEFDIVNCLTGWVLQRLDTRG